MHPIDRSGHPMTHDRLRAPRLAGLLLLAALALAACTPRGTGASGDFGAGPLVAAPPPEAAIERLERAMFDRLNDDRRQLGLPPLDWDDELSTVGRGHSLDMLDAGFFAHDSPRTGALEDRLTRAGYLFATARENLALGPDVDTAQDSLLDSPGHYANIMSDDVSHVGIGIVRGPFESDPDALYITQVFARRLERLDPADVQSSVVERLDEARRRIGLGVADRHDALDTLATDIAARDGRPGADEIERLALALRRDEGLDIASVGAVSVMLYELDDFEVVDALLDPSLVAVGIGCAETRDEVGRPTVSVVLLLASRQ